MRRPSFASLFVIILLLFIIDTGITFPQAAGRRVALVIGNSTYSMGPLRNAGNDATDMAAALRGIGFSVALGIDANKKTMYQLIDQFGTDFRGSEIALFYYSGHGVQAGGENYLIPVGTDISIASDVEIEGVQLQRLIGRMNSGGANTNVVILDACRNNPFPQASRDMERGLAVIGQKPPESVIVYATEAGETADDGSGRNGVFTAALLKHIGRNEEFTAILRDVNAEVRKETNQKQKPAKYDNLTRAVYLAGSLGVSQVPPGPATTIFQPSKLAGTMLIRVESAGALFVDGKPMGDLRKGGAKRLTDLEVGYYELEIRYTTGERESRSVQVEDGKEIEVQFLWKTFIPPSTTTTSTTTTIAVAASTTTTVRTALPTTTTTIAAPANRKSIGMIHIFGGSFPMGSKRGDAEEKPVHQVTLSPFLIGKYEVTQEQYRQVMGMNPSYFADYPQALRLPVENVTWFDAIAFCNRLSEMDSLQKVYTITGTDVRADFSKNGYRLPTEAEWEYAARGGASSRGYSYSGPSDQYGEPSIVAWWSANSVYTTRVVGTKESNELGLYDMSGNVWEWCGDWFGSYSDNPQIDPTGPSSGSSRVIRGGSWNYPSGYQRTAFRSSTRPDLQYNTLGFRVLRRP
ncbi:MAG: SUMF1/EgtB/PvdO family nonheme iron enzyme [Spirochaetes bacterium]|nr:SUMF1/EgtB/PvdO family nonheme iron enzyme [Spirochaetota bacterium]